VAEVAEYVNGEDDDLERKMLGAESNEDCGVSLAEAGLKTDEAKFLHCCFLLPMLVRVATFLRTNAVTSVACVPGIIIA
jgi:hypothetical protein